MIPKNLIHEYNEDENVLVITSYPPQGTVYGAGVGGVAAFAKNNLKPLALGGGRKYIVLAEILDKPEVYVENEILVIRCWRRNSFGLYWSILRHLKIFNQVNLVIMQFEFALYGDFLVAGFVPLFLTRVKSLGKKTIVVCHQVLTDLNSLSGHIGIAKHSPLMLLLSWLIKSMYQWISRESSKIVVLESDFKKRLKDINIPANKIKTIEHGVDLSLRPMPMKKARKVLGLKQNTFVVIIFGFLTWYKGSDLAVKAVLKLLEKNPSLNLHLILAGGESMTQQTKKHYRAYYQKLTQLTSQSNKIEITGFVKERDIRVYYGASDLLILPYRAYMSSSGPLSLALTFRKPFILSKPLERWLGYYQAYTGVEDLIFKPTISSLADEIEKVMENRSILLQLKRASEEIAKERNYIRIAQKYRDVLDEVSQ